MPEFPEVVISTAATTKAVHRALAAGRLRKLASRLYTSNLKDAPETIVRRNLWHIVAGYFPEAIIADRTALEHKPAGDGSIFLIVDGGRDVDIPGIKLRPRKGAGRLEGDFPMRPNLLCSSPPRAYLENMRTSRARSGVARTLKREEIEDLLERFLRESGEDAINKLRDQIRKLAPALELEAEGADLDSIIGALLGTRDARLTAASARARRAGEPFDSARIARFELLHDELRRLAPAPPRFSSLGDKALVNLAFFEAYFSNFIEGTEFEVDEARDIVFENRIPSMRPADAHDIVGTFRVVSDRAEMARVPTRFEEFIELLKARHAGIMEARPEKLPGEFKKLPNRAGVTSFVSPEDVVGTLRGGFDIYRRLDAPLDKAIFMMFLVSEVHPFADGNGRTARIMMNAELESARETRIIVPTIYRSNYLAGLKSLNLGDNPTTLIRTLDFAQRYTSSIDWSDFETALAVLRKTNAFVRPEEGDLFGIRLRLAIPADFADENDGGDGAGGGASGGP
ncbi:Fic family protein [Methylosinus sp. RM1]|uniref:Fic family protein n=1 Tax=Methylosinus sp. RM1 TaxID=2583817 RepID=UPI00140B3A16|nr:Fic family protein [Methylosinus sp. RM1]